MRAFINRLFAVIAAICLLPAAVNAQSAPTYGGTVFDTLTDVALDGSLFFGLIVVIALLVTGFFLGRKWLKRVG